jgi:hypothetical protein
MSRNAFLKFTLWPASKACCVLYIMPQSICKDSPQRARSVSKAEKGARSCSSHQQTPPGADSNARGGAASAATLSAEWSRDLLGTYISGAQRCRFVIPICAKIYHLSNSRSRLTRFIYLGVIHPAELRWVLEREREPQSTRESIDIHAPIW